jgi:hypothetical protein
MAKLFVLHMQGKNLFIIPSSVFFSFKGSLKLCGDKIKLKYNTS